jgi:hypothetical protein
MISIVLVIVIVLVIGFCSITITSMSTNKTQNKGFHALMGYKPGRL